MGGAATYSGGPGRRNRTKVGLKDAVLLYVQALGPGRNRTKVGLKGGCGTRCGTCTRPPQSNQGGIERQRIATAGFGAAAPQSNQGGIERGVIILGWRTAVLPQSNQGGIERHFVAWPDQRDQDAAIEPRWD